MLYVDFDLLRKFYDDELNQVYLRHVLTFAVAHEQVDIIMPLLDYTILMLNSELYRSSNGFRDDKNRPGIKVCGFTIAGISGEELEKYKVLK